MARVNFLAMNLITPMFAASIIITAIPHLAG
jgi:hypothetical protein